MKGKVNSDVLAKLAINHVEKLVLGIVLALFGLLIYSGLSIEPYPVSKSPENLTSTSNSVMTKLEGNHWAAIKDDTDRVVEVKYEKAVGTNQSTVDAGLDFPILNMQPVIQTTKRLDPAIDDPQYAPQHLEVAGVIGAFSSLGTKDPYKALKDAPEMKIEEEQVRRPSRSRSRSRNRNTSGSGISSMMSDYGGSGSGESESSVDMAMGMEGGGGRIFGGSGRTLDESYDKGFPGGAKGTFAQTQQFIFGTAVMPNELLDSAFLEALRNSKSFDVRRDRPRYIAFKVIRADVTGRTVDQLEEPDDAKIKKGEGDWVQTTSNVYMDTRHLSRWAGAPGEVISDEYIDNVLTTPLPPLMLQDSLPLAGHSMIPVFGEEVEEEKVETVEDAPKEVAGQRLGDVLDPAALRNRRADLKKRQTSLGAASSSMEMSMSMSMGSGEEMGSGDGEDFEMSSMGMEMGMGTGMSPSRSTVVVPAAEFKLIRFYDFRESSKTSPQPGRQYVYRIRVMVEDPNYPINRQMAPPLKTLDSEVLVRVNQQAADDAEYARQEGKPGYRSGFKWTAWSEPSPPASLPEMKWYAAGSVVPSGTQTLGGKTFPSPKLRPSASVVAVNWDWRYATERTADFKKVPLGTSLSKLGFEDEIVNPSTMTIKTLPNASVVTDGVLLDVAGGQPLAASQDEDNPMLAPGMMLLFDERGGLQVRNEIDDALNFRKYTFEDERERLKAKSVPAFGGGEYEEDGMSDDFSFDEG